MATYRDNPYSAFNFMVSLQDGQESSLVGGFSDVSGLGREVNYAEYRNGNESFNTVRKVANTYKSDDITLKRGLVGSTALFMWLKKVGDGEHDPRLVTVTLLDEARNPVSTWELRNAQPKKWTGPTLAAKGGSDVAMEELSLVCEECSYK
ncbi:MAG: phage tail protein [Xanthomonadales bacterium]|nr:phage tail protein [Xanthomonadales bacterium]